MCSLTSPYSWRWQAFPREPDEENPVAGISLMYGRDSARKSPECQTEECGFPSVVMGNGRFLTKGKDVGRFLS